jgi:hypothetical protein
MAADEIVRHARPLSVLAAGPGDYSSLVAQCEPIGRRLYVSTVWKAIRMVRGPSTICERAVRRAWFAVSASTRCQRTGDDLRWRDSH